MSAKRKRAKEVAEPRADAGLWIDHASIEESDIEWMRDVQRLILWNVTVPPGFLARIPKLWWLDIRGGSADNLEACRGAAALEYLAVNRVRGLHDLSMIADLRSLRYLDLYGLPKVSTFPSCAALERLQHVRIGQMRGLQSLGDVLDAPQLREFALIKMVPVSLQEADRIREHPSIERFGWFAEGVPNSKWVKIVERVHLPTVNFTEWPENWFLVRGRGSGRPAAPPFNLPSA